jgi:HSP20 family protein
MIEFWDEMMALERRMDDLFRVFLGPRARVAFPALPTGVRPFVPVTDVLGRNGDLLIRTELLGIDPNENVTVEIEDGSLVIKGERAEKEETKEKEHYRMESSYGSFERQIPLPEDIRVKDVTATYSGGVLEIVVPGAVKPVTPKADPKPVPIRTVKAA